MGSLVSGLPEPSLFLPHLCLCLAQFSNQRRGYHSTGHVPFHSLLREWRCHPPSDRVLDPGVVFLSTLSNPVGLTFQPFPESDLPPLLCCQPHPSVRPHRFLRGPAGASVIHTSALLRALPWLPPASRKAKSSPSQGTLQDGPLSSPPLHPASGHADFHCILNNTPSFSPALFPPLPLLFSLLGTLFWIFP